MAKRRKLTQEKGDRINRLRDEREGAGAGGGGPGRGRGRGGGVGVGRVLASRGGRQAPRRGRHHAGGSAMIVPARGLSLAGALAAMAAATGGPYDMPVLGYDP